MRIELLGNIDKEERARTVASAGMLSRAPGTVFDVYNSRENKKNNGVIKYICGMGHESIMEHDYYTFGIDGITPILEQILIGYRLTSFTVKSRREVDFSTVGYYTPTFHRTNGTIHEENRDLTNIYQKHMNSLFDSYKKYVDQDIPLEDARFVLPYSFHSTLVMGCDARELKKITIDLLYGSISNITEAKELGEKLKAIIDKEIPYLSGQIKPGIGHEFDIWNDLNDKMSCGNEQILECPTLISHTENIDDTILESMIMSRSQCSKEVAGETVKQLSLDDKRKFMRYLIENRRKRDLEQVSFQFQIPIILAVLTHLTRHRMQSLEVPNFFPLWNFENYFMPDSIQAIDPQGYQKIYKRNKEIKEFFQSKGVRDEDLIYFYLSGQMCNVLTTMNGHTLEWISRMRCCNKAQKPIRDIVNELVRQVEEIAPLYGMGLGSSCDVFGTCPEGKECCGKIYAKIDRGKYER